MKKKKKGFLLGSQRFFSPPLLSPQANLQGLNSFLPLPEAFPAGSRLFCPQIVLTYCQCLCPYFYSYPLCLEYLLQPLSFALTHPFRPHPCMSVSTKSSFSSASNHTIQIKLSHCVCVCVCIINILQNFL